MIAEIITLVAALAIVAGILSARNSVQHTTLVGPLVWAVVAGLGWVVAAGAGLLLNRMHPVHGQLWYTAAVLTICPLIAVLGARRPTIRVWNWFVVLPLTAVLLWPVALCWMPRGPERLALEAPHLAGLGVVLLMGIGNYIGTRWTVLAAATLVSIALVLSSVSRASMDAVQLRAWAAGALCLALWGARRFAARTVEQVRSWQRVWTDFRETFGIVWAHRIAERVNAEALKGNWATRLQPTGFVAARPEAVLDLEADRSAIDHTLRWLLRRFVDQDWLDCRVPQSAEKNYAAPGLNDGGSLAGKDSIEA
jgi:hypothetical protein